jgi:hypothetical protein
MISRRTARAFAELVEVTFRKRHSGTHGRWYYTPDSQALYDFLFDHGHAAWFCNAAQAVRASSSTRPLKEFFMQIHTGESLTVATSKWTWDQREALGQRYLTDLAEDLLLHWKDGPGQYGSHVVEPLSAFTRALELDGYRWDGHRLIPNEADVLDTAEESGVVRTLYHELALAEEETSFHHLQLTEEHYIAGRWDDSIANSRKFLESTLAQVARAHSEGKGSPASPDLLSRPGQVRDYLEREGLLEGKEKQAVASVYGLLSETGGHPYVAQHEQARLMRHLALTFAQFVMLRLRSARAAA